MASTARISIEFWQEEVLRRAHRTHTQAELAKLVKRSTTWVSRALGLLGLSTPWMDEQREGRQLRRMGADRPARLVLMTTPRHLRAEYLLDHPLAEQLEGNAAELAESFRRQVHAAAGGK